MWEEVTSAREKTLPVLPSTLLRKHDQWDLNLENAHRDKVNPWPVLFYDHWDAITVCIVIFSVFILIFLKVTVMCVLWPVWALGFRSIGSVCLIKDSSSTLASSSSGLQSERNRTSRCVSLTCVLILVISVKRRNETHSHQLETAEAQRCCSGSHIHTSWLTLSFHWLRNTATLRLDTGLLSQSRTGMKFKTHFQFNCELTKLH